MSAQRLSALFPRHKLFSFANLVLKCMACLPRIETSSETRENLNFVDLHFFII